MPVWHGRTERDPASYNRFLSGAVMPARKPGSGLLGGFQLGGRPLVWTPGGAFSKPICGQASLARSGGFPGNPQDYGYEVSRG
jgi:hypothetical protein